MGMPATEDRITTIEQLLALPEDGMCHELLDGVHAVTPSPQLPHQRAVRELLLLLAGHLGPRCNYEIFSSPADIVLGPNTLVQPDVFVVARAPGDKLESWSDAGVPVLAIEILSPSTAPRDRGVKRRIYQRAGVAEYWIVDIDARLIERWTSEDERPEICDATITWQLPTGAPGDIDVPQLFAGILGE